MFDNPTDNHTDIEVPLYDKLRFHEAKKLDNDGRLMDERQTAWYPISSIDYSVSNRKIRTGFQATNLCIFAVCRWVSKITSLIKIFNLNYKCDTLRQLSVKLKAQDIFALKKVD